MYESMYAFYKKKFTGDTGRGNCTFFCKTVSFANENIILAGNLDNYNDKTVYNNTFWTTNE